MAFAPPRKSINPSKGVTCERGRSSRRSSVALRSPSCPGRVADSQREREEDADSTLRPRALFTSTPKPPPIVGESKRSLRRSISWRDGDQQGQEVRRPMTRGRSSSLERDLRASVDPGSSSRASIVPGEHYNSTMRSSIRPVPIRGAIDSESMFKRTSSLRVKNVLPQKMSEKELRAQKEMEDVQEELANAKLEYSTAEIMHTILQDVQMQKSNKKLIQISRDLRIQGFVEKRKQVLIDTMKEKRKAQEKKLEELTMIERVLLKVKESVCSKESLEKLSKLEERILKESNFLPLKCVKFDGASNLPGPRKIKDLFKKIGEAPSGSGGFSTLLQSAQLDRKKVELMSANEDLNKLMDKQFELESLKASLKSLNSIME